MSILEKVWYNIFTMANKEATVEIRDQESIVRGTGLVFPDTFILWKKAAENTGVVVGNIKRENEMYWHGSVLRRVPSRTVRFDHSATPDAQLRWEDRRRELEGMLNGTTETSEDLREVIAEAKRAKSERLASYRRPSPTAHLV